MCYENKFLNKMQSRGYRIITNIEKLGEICDSQYLGI